MVVGSMIGSGVLLLPRRFGTETGVLGAIIAWTIAGALRVFRPAEAMLFGVIVLGAVVGVVSLATGAIEI